ncbi:MAG: hypothetical protein H6699_09410 [Myxococcales bacterium]|nr:hypothetical protein [Myxococcales bacterium]
MAKTPFARRARRRLVGIVLVLTTLRLAGACGDRAGDSDTSVDAVAEVGSDAGRSDTRADAGVDSTGLAEDAAPDVRDVQSDLDVGDVEDGGIDVSEVGDDPPEAGDELDLDQDGMDPGDVVEPDGLDGSDTDASDVLDLDDLHPDAVDEDALTDITDEEADATWNYECEPLPPTIEDAEGWWVGTTLATGEHEVCGTGFRLSLPPGARRDPESWLQVDQVPAPPVGYVTVSAVFHLGRFPGGLFHPWEMEPGLRWRARVLPLEPPSDAVRGVVGGGLR